MLVFSGTHINKVDRKGRVSVPAPFRATLAKAGATEITIFPSYNEKALEGLGPDILETLARGSFGSYNFYARDNGNLATHIFEVARQVEWDAEGRIGLPEELIAHAGLNEQAAFVGKGLFFQVWSPERLAVKRAADAAEIAQNPPRLPLNLADGK
jgi:MraZ protein